MWFYTTGSSGEVDDGEEEVDTGGLAGGPGAPSPLNQPGKPSHNQIGVRRKRHKALVNKPQDFQVLVAKTISDKLFSLGTENLKKLRYLYSLLVELPVCLFVFLQCPDSCSDHRGPTASW